MTGPSQWFWTDERVAVLRELRAKGCNAAQIARHLGITRNAVIGKASRLGIPTSNAAGHQPSVVPLPPKPVVEPPPEPVLPRPRLGGCECGGTRQPSRDQCASCITSEIVRQWAHRKPREPVA